jgi:hypothetical protein
VVATNAAPPPPESCVYVSFTKGGAGGRAGREASHTHTHALLLLLLLLERRFKHKRTRKAHAQIEMGTHRCRARQKDIVLTPSID